MKNKYICAILLAFAAHQTFLAQEDGELNLTDEEQLVDDLDDSFGQGAEDASNFDQDFTEPMPEVDGQQPEEFQEPVADVVFEQEPQDDELPMDGQDEAEVVMPEDAMAGQTFVPSESEMVVGQEPSAVQEMKDTVELKLNIIFDKNSGQAEVKSLEVVQ